jgi:pimeloyl-ACP methyl ester carboxylesterase
MPIVALPQGQIAYRDTGGPGPVLVLTHGLLMDASLWDAVVARLAGENRCITPTLPLGGHRQAMSPGARLGLQGQADLHTLVPLDQPTRLATELQRFLTNDLSTDGRSSAS